VQRVAFSQPDEVFLVTRRLPLGRTIGTGVKVAANVTVFIDRDRREL
jgi:hypothetical protein